jgi:hypothetical protein
MSENWNLFDKKVDGRRETYKSLFAYMCTFQPGELLDPNKCSPQEYDKYQKNNQGLLKVEDIFSIYGTWTAAWRDFSEAIFTEWQEQGILIGIEAAANNYAGVIFSRLVDRATVRPDLTTPETP